MSWLDTAVKNLNKYVFRPISSSIVNKLLSIPCSELDSWLTLSKDVLKGSYIKQASGDMLDQFAVDYGVVRTRLAYGLESDSSVRIKILNILQAQKVTQQSMIQALSSFSSNSPVIEEFLLNSWFIGESTDFYSLNSFLGVSSILQREQIDLNASINGYSSSYADIKISNPVLGYFKLNQNISFMSSNSFFYYNYAYDDKGLFQVGRKLKILGSFAEINTKVVNYSYVNGQVIVTVDSNSIDSSISEVDLEGETAFVIFKYGSKYFTWQAQIDGESGVFRINELVRADMLLDIFDYSRINSDNLATIIIRGEQDPQYRIEAVVSSSSLKYGSGINYGSGAKYGQILGFVSSDVVGLLNSMKAAGVKFTVMVKEAY